MAIETLIDNEEYVLEHYRALRDHFVSHGDRLWQRFNYFLTVEVALMGAFLLRPVDAAARVDAGAPILGVILSIVWYIVVAQDLWFYDDARKKLFDYRKDVIVPKIPEWQSDSAEFVPPAWKKPICFRIRGVGITPYSPICAVLFIVLWSAILGITIFR